MEKACAVTEIPDGAMKGFVVKDIKILIAHIDGTFYAVQGQCTHRGGPLAEGVLHNRVVTCPWHKAQFDVRNGKLVRDVGGVMKVLTAGGAKDLQTYPVAVKNGFVFVDV